MEACYEIFLVVLLKYKFNFSEYTAFGETCRRQPCRTFSLPRGQPILQVTLKTNRCKDLALLAYVNWLKQAEIQQAKDGTWPKVKSRVALGKRPTGQ